MCRIPTFVLEHAVNVLARSLWRDAPLPRRSPTPLMRVGLSARLVRRSYRAPEVIVGLPYGAKVDVVSDPTLGVLVIINSNLFEDVKLGFASGCGVGVRDRDTLSIS